VHIPKFRNGAGKILANASTPDFSGASDIILGYAPIIKAWNFKLQAFLFIFMPMPNFGLKEL
jgi:hypothetical protein